MVWIRRLGFNLYVQARGKYYLRLTNECTGSRKEPVRGEEEESRTMRSISTCPRSSMVSQQSHRDVTVYTVTVKWFRSLFFDANADELFALSCWTNQSPPLNSCINTLYMSLYARGPT